VIPRHSAQQYSRSACAQVGLTLGSILVLTTLGRIEETADNKGVPNWLPTHAAEDR
jgi:hypothetical protein